MATAEDALNLARAQLGKGPDEFCAWYPAPIGTPWCAIFQSWVLSSVGIPTHFAYVTYLFDLYRAQGRTFAPREAQPGDLVAFDYDGGGPGAYDHIAMVEYVDGDSLVCIDGNWANRVQRVRRWFDRPGFAGGIAEIARPTWFTPQPSPEEDDMKAVILVDARDGKAWHCYGNSRVYLSHPDQMQALNFLGIQTINPAPAAWIDALAIVPRNGGISTPGK